MPEDTPHWSFIGSAGAYSVWQHADGGFQLSKKGRPSQGEGSYKLLDTILGLKDLNRHHFAEGKRVVTVLVHPGSACGSADMNLGKYDARAARDGLVNDIVRVQGDLLVIDGSLSDELSAYPAYSAAIEEAISDALSRKHIVRRVRGSDDEDYDQTDAARDFIAEEHLDPETHRIHLTGAWFDRDGPDGCVNSVFEVFEAAGFSVDVMDSAISLDDSTLVDEEDLDFDEDDEADPAPTI